MSLMARRTELFRGKLLVVDDDLVQRTLIGRIAAKLGYDAVVAPSFDVAANLLQRDAFDMMTLDLSLGERDGIELLRLIAECGLHSMPIMIISGCDERILNSTRRVAQTLDLSVTNCLTKPLNLEGLRKALSSRQRQRTSARAGTAALDITRENILAGMERKEFSVEFQPKLDLENGEVIGAEALARWRSSDLGPVSPGSFIPAAERLGLMPELTDYLLAAAIAQGRPLVEERPGFTIAVNVCGSLLTDLSLPERIETMMRAQNLAPSSLIVEVTESAATSDVGRAMDILVRLRLKGFGAAIDDFGTGYSSLAALARLPFSELKIDQSFVHGCATDQDMMKIVEASIGLAKAFNMKVVAEGIDSPQALAAVRDAGCDVAQGFLFSPSLRPERIRSWIARYKSDVDACLTLSAPRSVTREPAGQSRTRTA